MAYLVNLSEAPYAITRLPSWRSDPHSIVDIQLAGLGHPRLDDRKCLEQGPPRDRIPGGQISSAPLLASSHARP